MTEELAARPQVQGPTWRVPRRDPWEQDRALVLCRCGVDMDFVWPVTRTEVRCFGCGNRFERPVHLGPPRVLVPWQPPPPPGARRRPAARLREALTGSEGLVLLLSLLAAALLGVGLGMALAK